MPWTVTLPASRLTLRTLPRLPLSSPAMTSTMSLMRMYMGHSRPDGPGLLAFLVGNVLPQRRVVFLELEPTLGVVPVLLDEVAMVALGADKLDIRPGVFRFLGHGAHLREQF